MPFEEFDTRSLNLKFLAMSWTRGTQYILYETQSLPPEMIGFSFQIWPKDGEFVLESVERVQRPRQNNMPKP